MNPAQGAQIELEEKILEKRILTDRPNRMAYERILLVDVEDEVREALSASLGIYSGTACVGR